MKTTLHEHKPQRVVTIRCPEDRYTVLVALQRSRQSVRGNQEYRTTLKDIIGRLEQELGPYRRKR